MFPTLFHAFTWRRKGNFLLPKDTTHIWNLQWNNSGNLPPTTQSHCWKQRRKQDKTAAYRFMSASSNPALFGGKQYGDQKTTQRNTPRQINSGTFTFHLLLPANFSINFPKTSQNSFSGKQGWRGAMPWEWSSPHYAALLAKALKVPGASIDWLKSPPPTQGKGIFEDARSNKEVCAQWDNPLYGLNTNRAASVSTSFTPSELWHL